MKLRNKKTGEVFDAIIREKGGAEIIILQIMSFGDGELLVEYAYKKELCGEEEE